MKHIFLLTTLLLSSAINASEQCVTSEFGGITTVRCKDGGEVVSVCKSREFAGKIYTNCDYK